MECRNYVSRTVPYTGKGRQRLFALGAALCHRSRPEGAAKLAAELAVLMRTAAQVAARLLGVDRERIADVVKLIDAGIPHVDAVATVAANYYVIPAQRANRV